jgi:hypothetical protein
VKAGIFASVGVATLLGCSGDAGPTNSELEQAMPSLEDVTAEEWQRLGAQRFFFGHQSVGGDLLAGLQEILAADPTIPLRVIESDDPSAMSEPGLYHYRIGENGVPHSKLEAFQSIVGADSSDPSTALIKFCYLDVAPGTDPRALFDSYQRTIAELRQKKPSLRIVHLTLPLTSDRGTLFHWRTVVRGNTSMRELNWVREQYNQLLRATYGGTEPVFDLARLESRGPDGNPVTVRFRGSVVPVMASEWTYDGGHLTPEARRAMAEVFLATLAKL